MNEAEVMYSHAKLQGAVRKRGANLEHGGNPFEKVELTKNTSGKTTTIDTLSDSGKKRIVSAALFQGQPDEIFLFCFVFSFCTHEQLKINFKYSKNRT